MQAFIAFVLYNQLSPRPAKIGKKDRGASYNGRKHWTKISKLILMSFRRPTKASKLTTWNDWQMQVARWSLRFRAARVGFHCSVQHKSRRFLTTNTLTTLL